MTSGYPLSRSDSPNGRAATDVCILVEGCYPYVAGGVSSWIDWLMRTQSDRTFGVVSIMADKGRRQVRYQRTDNLVTLDDLALYDHGDDKPRRSSANYAVPSKAREIATPLLAMLNGGGLRDFEELVAVVNRPGAGLSQRELLDSQLAFEVVRLMYQAITPHASFLQFYWAWRALFGGLFAVLKFRLPQAKLYHAIATGYSGMLAARAVIETGRPAAITEHGIYTNERRIEILMADWIADSVDKGLKLDDARMDLRELWINVFEAYARVCYQACTKITTLYSDNQHLQLASGAERAKLQVIANGIDLERFNNLPAPNDNLRPTIALIGRVVPIKDIKTFIASAAIVRARVPNLVALVLGPTDEDPAYFEECRSLVNSLKLQDCVTFTGSVRITDYMRSIQVVILTSLSEAQPLVLLEAGAAGIPCVATNVGACREIIDGVGEGRGVPAPGGFVTDLVAPDQLADAVCQLLGNAELRRRLGETLRGRVHELYASDISRRGYSDLYDDLVNHPTRRLDRRVG